MEHLINEQMLVTKAQYELFKSRGQSFPPLAIPIYQLINQINCKVMYALQTNRVSFDLTIDKNDYDLYGKAVLDYTRFTYVLNQVEPDKLIVKIKLED